MHPCNARLTTTYTKSTQNRSRKHLSLICSPATMSASSSLSSRRQNHALRFVSVPNSTLRQAAITLLSLIRIPKLFARDWKQWEPTSWAAHHMALHQLSTWRIPGVWFLRSATRPSRRSSLMRESNDIWHWKGTMCCVESQ